MGNIMTAEEKKNDRRIANAALQNESIGFWKHIR